MLTNNLVANGIENSAGNLESTGNHAGSALRSWKFQDTLKRDQYRRDSQDSLVASPDSNREIIKNSRDEKTPVLSNRTIQEKMGIKVPSQKQSHDLNQDQDDNHLQEQ